MKHQPEHLPLCDTSFLRDGVSNTAPLTKIGIHIFKRAFSWEWWSTPVTLVLGRWEQRDQTFKVGHLQLYNNFVIGVGYTKHHLKKKKVNKKPKLFILGLYLVVSNQKI